MARAYESAMKRTAKEPDGGEDSHKSITATKAAITKASNANPGGRDATRPKPTPVTYGLYGGKAK